MAKNLQRILQNLIDHAHGCLAYLDTDFNFVAVNQAYALGCNYSPEQLIGQNHFAFFPNAENEAIFKTVLETGEKVSCHDKPFAFPDQPERGITYWDWTLTPVLDDSGQIEGLVYSLFETTERKRAELQLQQNQQKLRTIFDTMHEGVALNECIYNEKGEMVDYRILEVNDNFYKRAGYFGTDVMGNVATQLYGLSPALIKDFWESHRTRTEAIQSDIYSPLNHQWYRVMTSPFYNGTFVTSFSDITAQKQAEIALKESTLNLRAAQDMANMGHWTLDVKNNHLMWSENIYKLFEVNPESFESSYDAFLDFVHPEDQDLVNEAYVNSLKTKQPYEIQHRIRMPDGRIKWVSEKCATTYDESGEPICSTGIVQDITQHKDMELALRESEKLYRLLFEQAEDCILITDSQGRILDVNPAGCLLLGYTYDEMNTLTIHDFFLPEDPSARLKELNNGAKLISERKLRRKDQSIILTENRAQRRVDGNLQAIIRDVTHRNEMELALRQSEAMYRLLFEQAEDCIMIANPQGKYLDINPAGCLLLGYTYDEIIEMSIPDIMLPEDVSFAPPRLQELNEGTRILSERWLIRKDRTKVLTEIKAQRRSDGNLQAIVRDITERKKVETELRTIQQNLEQMVLERTTELNKRTLQLSQLTSELLQTEQRERRRLAEQLHDNLQQILIAAKLHLEQLSGLSQPQMEKVHKIEVRLKESIAVSRSLTFDLCPPILFEGCLRDVLEWLSRRTTDLYGLDIALEMPDNFKALSISDDVKYLVFQSVREILLNIVKHAGVNHAAIRIQLLPDHLLEIAVCDQGAGFDTNFLYSDENLNQIGFGLFSVKERLRSLGGHLNIQSVPSQGTTVTLIAPLAMKPDVVFIEPHPLISLSQPPLNQSRPLHVLLVDDHAILREGMMGIISTQESLLVVGQAINGFDAIEKARSLKPDVILMDISMPEMDGILATRVILSELPDTCVVGLSMYDKSERADAMLSAGAKAFFNKSDNMQDIIAFIHAVFSRN